LLSPARRRACIKQVRAQLHVSERRACAALGQHRSTQRKVSRGRDDEQRLTADIIELAGDGAMRLTLSPITSFSIFWSTQPNLKRSQPSTFPLRDQRSIFSRLCSSGVGAVASFKALSISNLASGQSASSLSLRNASAPL